MCLIRSVIPCRKRVAVYVWICTIRSKNAIYLYRPTNNQYHLVVFSTPPILNFNFDRLLPHTEAGIFHIIFVFCATIHRFSKSQEFPMLLSHFNATVPSYPKNQKFHVIFIFCSTMHNIRKNEGKPGILCCFRSLHSSYIVITWRYAVEIAWISWFKRRIQKNNTKFSSSAYY